MMAIAPYLVGFAPPDTSGTFIALQGGRGAYPSASCGNHYQNTYSEIGFALDHKIETKNIKNPIPYILIIPQHITLGVFAEKGWARYLTVYSEPNFEGQSDDYAGHVRLGSLFTRGMHFSADWETFGLDLGVINLCSSELVGVSPSVLSAGIEFRFT